MCAFQASPIPSGTNNLVEVNALLTGLVLARKCGLSNIHIEGDSLVIISSITSKISKTWQLSYVLKHTLDLLDTFSDYSVSHTLREGNSVADLLANMGCDGISVESIAIPSKLSSFPKLLKLVQKESTTLLPQATSY